MTDKKQRTLSSQCSVCSGPSASHLHYGAVSCYSCRAFFRRGIGKPYCCVEGSGDCAIDWTSRRSCQSCRFDKCLRMGMNPELVDASLRKKSSKKRPEMYEEPVLIDNLKPLENAEIVSTVFKEICSNDTDHVTCSLLTTVVGDLGDEPVYLLQESLVQGPDSFYYPPPVSTSLMSETGRSPTSSLDYSDFTNDMDTIDTAEDGLDIFLENIQNSPETSYQFSGQQPASFFHSFNNHPSVIVRPSPTSTVTLPQYDLKLSTCQDQVMSAVDFEFLESVRVMTDVTSVTSDDTSGTGDESDYDEEEKRHVFDIETLVEECFQQMGEK